MEAQQRQLNVILSISVGALKCLPRLCCIQTSTFCHPVFISTALVSPLTLTGENEDFQHNVLTTWIYVWPLSNPGADTAWRQGRQKSDASRCSGAPTIIVKTLHEPANLQTVRFLSEGEILSSEMEIIISTYKNKREETDISHTQRLNHYCAVQSSRQQDWRRIALPLWINKLPLISTALHILYEVAHILSGGLLLHISHQRLTVKGEGKLIIQVITFYLPPQSVLPVASWTPLLKAASLSRESFFYPRIMS